MFFSAWYASSPSGPFLVAQVGISSRWLVACISGTPYPHEVRTRSTSTSYTWREPGSGGNSPTSSSQSASSGWTVRAEPNSRRISGSRSNEQNISVIRLVSSRWAAVSLPEPVPFSQATRCGPSTRKESSPFGETFTWPSRAAVATKNIGCRSMNVRWRSEIASCCLAMGPFSAGRPIPRTGSADFETRHPSAAPRRFG